MAGDKEKESKKEVCEVCGQEIKLDRKKEHEHKKGKVEKEDRSVICEFC